MTPEQVFARLRDVHTPDIAAASGGGLAPEPLIVFVVGAATILAVRAVILRRRASARLAAISETLPPADQRDRIAKIFRNSPIRKDAPHAPPAFFAPPWRLTDNDAADIRAWARRRLR